MKPTMGSLFAGIGGFDLGFERAGFKTLWQVEIDPYCRKVLARHFPKAERFEDVRECGKHNLRPVDVICGGFPCQDISNAGKRAGIDGERSGLWSEFARIIGELRPHFVVVENVAALLGRGIGRVLGDLAEIGYDAEWEVISAADMGAPHLRERVWIVAYPLSQRHSESKAVIFSSPHEKWHGEAYQQGRRPVIGEIIAGSKALANATSERRREEGKFRYDKSPQRTSCGGEEMADAFRRGQQGSRLLVNAGDPAAHRQGQAGDVIDVRFRSQWAVEPDVGRVAHGIPSRMDRLKGLGNAVVPQIPELIARRLMEVPV